MYVLYSTHVHIELQANNPPTEPCLNLYRLSFKSIHYLPPYLPSLSGQFATNYLHSRRSSRSDEILPGYMNFANERVFTMITSIRGRIAETMNAI